MIRSAFLLFLLLFSSPTFYAATADAPPMGTTWTLEGLNGETLSDVEVREGSTVIVVWASWSPRCQDIVPRVQSLQSE